MACDIHVHVEVKIDGVWEHLGAPRVMRSYRLFAKMADVRNDDEEITPLSTPRGLPLDASGLTRFISDLDGVDGHSHSWLSASEMSDLSRWWNEEFRGVASCHRFEGEFGYLFGNSWEGWSRYPEDRPAGVEDVRCVFWFDN